MTTSRAFDDVDDLHDGSRVDDSHNDLHDGGGGDDGHDDGSEPAALRAAWTRACVLGELLGFVPPALAGATLGALGAPDAVMVLGLTLAGLLEGAALGRAQAWVLRRDAPTVDHHGWVRATVAAAGFAWFVGMGGGALLGADILPGAVAAIVLVPAWTAALLAMGYAQWRVLRRTVPRSGRWVTVTAGAWLVGVMIPVVALSVTPNGWPPWAFVAVGVAAAVAMGFTVGAITGTTLARLLAGAGGLQPDGAGAGAPPTGDAGVSPTGAGRR